MGLPKSISSLYQAGFSLSKTNNQDKKLENIHRGNTCKGVNREIISYLLSLNTDFAYQYFLDIPCGEGAFLKALHDFFPHSKTFGGDICLPSTFFAHEIFQIDAQRGINLQSDRKFNIITCISGVMEFDNTLNFFESVKENLEENGSFIVTNDYILTVRDRFLYLLFGRFRQFRFMIGKKQPTWKLLTFQNLLRILYEAGFEVEKIKYVPVRPREWGWLPLALFVYFFQCLYMMFAEKEIPFSEKRSLYPFMSLLSRHYILVCRNQDLTGDQKINQEKA